MSHPPFGNNKEASKKAADHDGGTPPAVSPILANELPLNDLASEYVALLITSVALRLSRSASGFYGKHWGIGNTEYRLILGLGLNGDCNAMQLAAVADVDRGAVSRSLKDLKKRGLINFVRQGRELQIRLTDAGLVLFHSIREVSLHRDRALTDGMSQEQISQFRNQLHRILNNVTKLDSEINDKT